MPQTYAHRLFGKENKQNLPPKTAQAVNKYPDLYELGLLGADIFHYFALSGKNAMRRKAFAFHCQPFSVALDAAKANGQDSEKCAAYFAGLACHFVLDKNCHTLIDEVCVSAGKRQRINAEFDRTLILAQNENPFTFDKTQGLVCSNDDAEFCARVFDVSPQTFKTAFSRYVLWTKRVNPKTSFARNFWRFSLCCSVVFAKHRYLFLTDQPEKNSFAVSKTLEKVFFDSLTECKSLLENLDGFWFESGALSPVCDEKAYAVKPL